MVSINHELYVTFPAAECYIYLKLSSFILNTQSKNNPFFFFFAIMCFIYEQVFKYIYVQNYLNITKNAFWLS